MSVRHYVGIIERGRSGFGVFFSDFPGCVSAGNSQEEAVAGARQALAGHAQLMSEWNERLPEPSPADAIEIPDDVEEVGRVLIPLERIPALSGRRERRVGFGSRARVIPVFPQELRLLRGGLAQRTRDARRGKGAG